ncbi:transcriptional regulator with XRE-family HTH domain [Paenibacillus turicensis]|uniref:Transcriptional regulator with XRE-family HTH domain n=1 Tax=Paenibacillus turicensis TaxID=160487 RepID=A0ABS4FSC8_9BACL|nr:helix-turn-helix transcriptional regulator [Paenibacillus turicensis]MBP1905498.1 transcriptional regulator with XRE-family HTH domain [Paenibacillus turicensis]
MLLTSEVIRICRINLGMSQGELARASGVSCPMLGAIERGDRALLPHVARSIRQALKLTDAQIDDIVKAHKRVNKNGSGI